MLLINKNERALIILWRPRFRMKWNLLREVISELFRYDLNSCEAYFKTSLFLRNGRFQKVKMKICCYEICSVNFVLVIRQMSVCQCAFLLHQRVMKKNFLWRWDLSEFAGIWKIDCFNHMKIKWECKFKGNTWLPVREVNQMENVIWFLYFLEGVSKWVFW